ncbi:MAG: hypothetical protein QNK18_00225 [Gammaproteobacteria bacterium]|nr:hypothetical protein [Gammaproteobacteria bacterium]MDJ0889608.1 hypothetical protein [Gammaproteobacteria bacterium]
MHRLMITGITFGVFMTEAIIHYSLGMSKAEGKFRLHFPPPGELAKVAAVTGVFSVVSGQLIGAVERRFGK